MKIKLNKQESQVIDDVTDAVHWLMHSEPDELKWDKTFKKFNKLLREKFILESDNRKNQDNQKTVCLYNRNDGYTYIFSSKLGWVAYPTLDDENPNFLNPIHVEDLNIPDQKKNALLAWLENEQRHHGLVKDTPITEGVTPS